MARGGAICVVRGLGRVTARAVSRNLGARDEMQNGVINFEILYTEELSRKYLVAIQEIPHVKAYKNYLNPTIYREFKLNTQ